MSTIKEKAHTSPSPTVSVGHWFVSGFAAAHGEMPVQRHEPGGHLQVLADVVGEGRLPRLPGVAAPLVDVGSLCGTGSQA
ncbi:hypothetical protein [Streptomyces sp. GS7]|uniref:hypothetical protein n=1 Tax=Streptomyces sp. GS7 TaxID=2692234 RepID=UPI0013181314|nr:hypothetical protein [Streptomyces sp. GS7]QHC23166.1 hypothetical protein GR130_18855 [Streptomyces sp. GS7]